MATVGGLHWERSSERGRNDITEPGKTASVDASPYITHASTVVDCYSLFDKFFPACGLLDYTEGIYNNDPSTTYEQAQQNQIDYVLDQVDCGPGVRMLEIGCGNGNLLGTAQL
jgi:cyclopropane fatty-acyl-phospholipid synthase-like methyltransferase